MYVFPVALVLFVVHNKKSSPFIGFSLHLRNSLKFMKFLVKLHETLVNDFTKLHDTKVVIGEVVVCFIVTQKSVWSNLIGHVT